MTMPDGDSIMGPVHELPGAGVQLMGAPHRLERKRIGRTS